MKDSERAVQHPVCAPADPLCGPEKLPCGWTERLRRILRCVTHCRAYRRCLRMRSRMRLLEGEEL